MRAHDRTAEAMMMANPSSNELGLKDNCRPVITTSKRFTRSIGRKHTLRVRSRKARWRALCAHRPECAGCIRAAEGDQ